MTDFEYIRGRCPVCATKTTIEHATGDDYEWAKIECPHSHETAEFSPQDIPMFINRHKLPDDD